VDMFFDEMHSAGLINPVEAHALGVPA
jgi:hypothetical protein